jgi:hypothetical protein
MVDESEIVFEFTREDEEELWELFEYIDKTYPQREKVNKTILKQLLHAKKVNPKIVNLPIRRYKINVSKN